MLRSKFRFIPFSVPLLFYPFKKILADTDKQDEKEATALIIGPTGAGKSFIGDLILGKNLFPNVNDEAQANQDQSFIERSNTVKLEHTERNLTLIEATGFFNENLSNKSIFNGIIDKLRTIARVNKIIYVYPYSSRIENYHSYLLGALSYCINCSSNSFLLVINKIEDHSHYNTNTKKWELNKDVQQDNINSIQQVVRNELRDGFDYVGVKKCSYKSQDEQIILKQYQQELLKRIFTRSIIDKRKVKTWDEFFSNNPYTGHQQKNYQQLLRELSPSNNVYTSSLLGGALGGFIGFQCNNLISLVIALGCGCLGMVLLQFILSNNMTIKSLNDEEHQIPTQQSQISYDQDAQQQERKNKINNFLDLI